MTAQTLKHQQIAYTAEGDPTNPAIILLHGWFSHGGGWYQTIDALKDRYYCVAPDLLGFGESDKPKDGDYSIEAQGKRVLALADALTIDRFILIGHSMGGQTALCIASMLAPERVSKLVDVSGVVSGQPTQLTKILEALSIEVVWRFPPLWPLVYGIDDVIWWIRKQILRPFFHDAGAIPELAEAIDRYLLIRPGIVIPMHKAYHAICSLDLRPHLAKIVAPTLVIFGALDAIVPVSDGRLVCDQVANSRLVLINKCGHIPHYERPVEYLQALETFLREE